MPTLANSGWLWTEARRIAAEMQDLKPNESRDVVFDADFWHEPSGILCSQTILRQLGILQRDEYIHAEYDFAPPEKPEGTRRYVGNISVTVTRRKRV